MEIARDRAAEWANRKIDEHAGGVVNASIDFIANYLSYPIAWTVIAAIVILLFLFIHSYFAEYKEQVSSESGKLDEESKRHDKENVGSTSGNAILGGVRIVGSGQRGEPGRPNIGIRVTGNKTSDTYIESAEVESCEVGVQVDGGAKRTHIRDPKVKGPRTDKKDGDG